jgi:hypothetical protein
MIDPAESDRWTLHTVGVLVAVFLVVLLVGHYCRLP